MKIRFRTQPTPDRFRGWRRVVRRVKNILRGTLIINVGRLTQEFAN